MSDKEFLSQFDDFTRDVVVKLREALATTIKDLKCSNTKMALAQVEIIRERSVHRLENIHRPIDLLDRSETHVGKVHDAVLTIIHHALDDAKEFILDGDESIYGPGDNDAADTNEAPGVKAEAKPDRAATEERPGAWPTPDTDWVA